LPAVLELANRPVVVDVPPGRGAVHIANNPRGIRLRGASFFFNAAPNYDHLDAEGLARRGGTPRPDSRKMRRRLSSLRQLAIT
jgi:hypothetical protein